MTRASGGSPGKKGKSKLTPERAGEILQLIEAGNYIEVACAAAGVSQTTYFNWLATGRDVTARLRSAYGLEPSDVLEWDESETPDGGVVENPWPEEFTEYEKDCCRFLEDANKAQARSEAYAVAIVRKHMPDQWTAAMTYLERRYPGRWKRRELHEVGEAASDKDQEIEAALLNDPEAMKQLHEALAKASRGALPAAEQ